jgi:hypothetical protein
MSGPLSSLIWKEWREQCWKPPAACLVIAAYTGLGLGFGVCGFLPNEGVVFLGFVAAVFLLPVFAVVDLAGVRRTGGSLEFLLSLPVSPRVILAVKGLAGSTTCVLPFIAAFVVARLVCDNEHAAACMPLRLCLAAITACLSTFVWVYVLSAGQLTGGRTALVGIAIIYGWIAVAIAPVKWLGLNPEPWGRLLLLVNPLGLLYYLPYGPRYGLLLCTIGVQTLAGICLFRWGASRFARLEGTQA